MDTQVGVEASEWEQLRAELLADPENHVEYERTLHETLAIRKLLQQVEEARRNAGLSKADLAARAGMNPASLRRLLTSEIGNPTLRTIIGLLDALGLELTVQRAAPVHGNGPLGQDAVQWDEGEAVSSGKRLAS